MPKHRQLTWDRTGLNKIFDANIAVGRYEDLENQYSLIRHVKAEEWANKLNDLAKEKGIDISFN